MQARRIQTEAERLGNKGAAGDNGMSDLVVFYTDRLLGRVPLTEELFSLALATLGAEQRQVLAKALFAGRPDEELQAIRGEDGYPDAKRLRRFVMDTLERNERRRGPEPAETVPPLPASLIEAETIIAFQSCHAGRELADPYGVQRDRLAGIFGLEEAEVEILLLLWCSVNEPRFRYAVDSLLLPDFHKGLAACAGVGLGEIKRLLAPRSRLLEMGFLEPDYMPPPHFTLGNEIREFFHDPNTLFSFVLPLKTYMDQALTRQAPLDSFSVPPVSRGILEAILRGGKANVLIHGAPGTGKTTFVASLIESLELPAFIMSAIGGSEDERPPLLRLKVASHLARNAGAVLVVDESDSLINTRDRSTEGSATTKAWLTEFMDCQAGVLIWIANDVDHVHDAVKRRFIYSLEFKPQNQRQRALLWKELVRSYGFEEAVGQEAIESLARSHAVNAGGIDIALRGLRCIVPGENHPESTGGIPDNVQTTESILVLSDILRRHETLMSGGWIASKTLSAGRNERYLPEAINVDTKLDELVEGLSEVALGLRTRLEIEAAGGVFTPGGHDGGSLEILEAKLLFAGGPGTGKTAFATWLATALQLPLVQKRASDLLSPFVGVTEQLIAAAFEEAEETGAILLLDEADSLFIDRQHAGHSWERSQTNELLTRMEAFSGILVCCTNRREDFDGAAMRRFQWKLNFSPPLPGQRLELYRRYFSELCGELDAASTDAIKHLDGLCPGDFAAVYKALVPISAIRRKGIPQQPLIVPRTESRLSHHEVLSRLRAELDYRSKLGSPKIGFGN
jgi:SpoVK/Ycf46/Vps4 family AAA+-type ATPase